MLEQEVKTVSVVRKKTFCPKGPRRGTRRSPADRSRSRRGLCMVVKLPCVDCSGGEEVCRLLGYVT